jgi:genome maintenance exonuclease 1
MMEQKRFTHIEKTWDIEDLKTVNEGGSRFYASPIGNLPSVTTVTGWEKSKFFAKWRRENPDESKRVLSRGNLLHQTIEDYINNKDIDLNGLPTNEAKLFMNLLPLIDKIDNVYELEVSLWSESTMLAGRADCIAEYNGKLSVIDFKGSTRVKRKEDIENYFIQASAYAIAWQERTGIPITNFAILISCENGQIQTFEGNPIDYAKPLLKAIEGYHENTTVMS